MRLDVPFEINRLFYLQINYNHTYNGKECFETKIHFTTYLWTHDK